MPPNEQEQVVQQRIERALKNGLQVLRLSRLGLTYVPKSLGQLTQLTELNLSGNQLTSMPESLGQLTQLTNLTRLDLSSNQLTSMPKSLGQLTNLTWLNLSGNQLTGMPESLGQLTNLTRLNLSGNQLTSMPESLGQLTNLTWLNLSGNQLTSMPESLGQLTNLTWLDLSGNQLTGMPKSLGQLTNLTELDLSGNQLTSMPESLGQLTNLTELDLSGNQLTSMPESLGQLTKLTRLDLFGNPLPISEGILNLDQRAYLSLLHSPTLLLAYWRLHVAAGATDQNQGARIEYNALTFPPQYHQACIGLLTYFATVLRQKYPTSPNVPVRIEQEGLTVRLVIEPPAGEREIIERTLKDYVRVLGNKIPPEEFLQDPMAIMQLRYRLDMAHMEVRYTRDLLQIAERQYEQPITSLEADVQHLRRQQDRAATSEGIFRELSEVLSTALLPVHSVQQHMHDLTQLLFQNVLAHPTAREHADVREALVTIQTTLQAIEARRDEQASEAERDRLATAMRTVYKRDASLSAQFVAAYQAVVYGFCGSLLVEIFELIADK